MILSDIPLRERKAAKTKVELLNTMLKMTVHKPLAEITVKELCREIDISDATFFNYFPKKEDLLLYFIRLWSRQVYYLAEVNCKDKPHLYKIEYILLITSDDKTIGNERIMGEIISLFALNDFIGKITLDTLSDAELLIAFPELPDIINFPIESFDQIFVKYLNMAMLNGELPKNIDMNDALLSLGLVFMGIPLMLGPKMYFQLGGIYSLHLHYLWNRLREQYKLSDDQEEKRESLSKANNRHSDNNAFPSGCTTT